MFIITDENMLKTDYEQNYHSNGFDPIDDIEVLSQQNNLCMVRTEKLLPTLFFMQRAWWRLYEMHWDDKDTEAEILIYYKPKCKTT